MDNIDGIVKDEGEIDGVNNAIAELDFIYQDGAIFNSRDAIFNSRDVERLAGLSKHLAGIVKGLRVNSFGQVRD